MFMKTTGNGLTLIALSTGGASLVRVAATIVAAFGSASEEKGASASAGALISNQKWWVVVPAFAHSDQGEQPSLAGELSSRLTSWQNLIFAGCSSCLPSRRSTRRERQGLR